jgi:NTE family protein
MTRVGVVLGGGGIVGMAYHGAVLTGLFEATGWDPRGAEVVVGTSAGAASGAELRAGLAPHDLAARRAGTPFSREGERRLVALGPPPQSPPVYVDVDEDRVRAAFRRLMARATAAPGSVRPGVLVSLAMAPGHLSAAWLTHQVHWLHGGDAWPERAFWPCAVDLDSGERIVFGREGAPPATPGQAVAASCAIPGVNAPVAVGDRRYIDGGGYSPTNADVLAGLGLDLVIAVSPMSATPECRMGKADGTVRRACGEMLAAEVAQLRAEGTAVAVIEPEQDDLPAMGHILADDVLDEARCGAIVAHVRTSTVDRILAGRLPELDALGPQQLSSAA